MSKPFSLADLSDQMDRDMNWRLKEISDLKATIRRADAISRPVLLRAFVALVYAHWEGHVRFCASRYFQHIALRRLPYSQLETQIYLNAFLPRLDSFFRSRGTVEEKCRFIEEILTARSRRFAQINPSLVDTKANLNTDVLRDLCKICGITYGDFEREATFIDVIVLKRRNEIAHGEEIYPGENEIDDIADRAVAIMRLFRNLLENKVYTRQYMAAS